MKKAWYAHPVILFGSALQKADIAHIEAAGFEVINPDDDEKQMGYRAEGMAYFEKLVDACDVLFFRAFTDGSIGAGVVKEIRWAAEAGKPIFEMPRSIDRRELSVDDTRTILIESGRR